MVYYTSSSLISIENWEWSDKEGGGEEGGEGGARLASCVAISHLTVIVY